VAGRTGTGGSVVVGAGLGNAADVPVGAGVDTGVASVGVTICGAGWAGCSSTMAVAAAAVSVATTTPTSTMRRDQRPSSASAAGASGPLSGLIDFQWLEQVVEPAGEVLPEHGPMVRALFAIGCASARTAARRQSGYACAFLTEDNYVC
jgi:hypothetical protein